MYDAALLILLLAGGPCLGTAEPPGEPLHKVEGIDVAACLRATESASSLGDGTCPDFLVRTLTEAWQTCRDAGGRLLPAGTAEVWGGDVDRDGRDELAFAHDTGISCDGAWSIFSCGSLECPLHLYRQHDGVWRPIAAIDADHGGSIELLRTVAKGYRTMRVGCAEASCSEYAFYEWTGARYERTHLLVRGYRVDLVGSEHGLRRLAEGAALLTAPTADGTTITRLDAGTEVAIVGTARGREYYFVSPCNACERGFVAKSAVCAR